MYMSANNPPQIEIHVYNRKEELVAVYANSECVLQLGKAYANGAFMWKTAKLFRQYIRREEDERHRDLAGGQVINVTILDGDGKLLEVKYPKNPRLAALTPKGAKYFVYLLEHLYNDIFPNKQTSRNRESSESSESNESEEEKTDVHFSTMDSLLYEHAILAFTLQQLREGTDEHPDMFSRAQKLAMLAALMEAIEECIGRQKMKQIEVITKEDKKKQKRQTNKDKTDKEKTKKQKNKKTKNTEHNTDNTRKRKRTGEDK